MANDEQTPQEAADAPEADGSRRTGPGRIVLMVAFLVALLAGGGLGATVVGPAVGTRLASGGSGGGSGSHGHGGDGPALHVIENLVVNPAGSEGTRFLLVSVAIRPAEGVAVEVLSGADVEIRDALIEVLGGKTVEELVDLDTRRSLRSDMLAAIEGVVGQGNADGIFLPQFVIQ